MVLRLYAVQQVDAEIEMDRLIAQDVLELLANTKDFPYLWASSNGKSDSSSPSGIESA